MTWPRRALPDALAAALVALAIYLSFGHAFLNYDTFYSLVWGNDVAHLRQPQYDVPVAPTPHPLAIAVGAAASPLGDSAEGVMLALVVLALGALAVGLFRLGEELYGWPVGLLAAGIATTRVPLLNFGIRGYVDLPTIALIVWAAVLEARRPRRGAAVLVLLGLAGLLRPEAWLFAAAYWLWLAPRLGWPARLRLAALAAAAPVLWGLSDLIVTGDPLWSLHGTTELATQLQRKTGSLNVLLVGPRRVGEIVRLPELLAAVIGLGFGLVWLRRRTLLPAAVAALNGVAFAVFGIARLPLLGRYLFLAGAVFSLLAALGVLGWRTLEAGHAGRGPWRALGLAAALGIAVFFPLQQLDRLSGLRDDIAARDRVHDDLHALVHAARAGALVASCRPLFVPTHTPVPDLAYWTGTPPSRVISATLQRPSPEGLLVFPATPEVQKLSILDPHDPKVIPLRVPPGYRLAARNRSWLLYSGPACRTGSPAARHESKPPTTSVARSKPSSWSVAAARLDE